MDVKFDANTKIADSEREFKMNQAAYQKEVNTAVSLFALNLCFFLIFALTINCDHEIKKMKPCVLYAR